MEYRYLLAVVLLICVPVLAETGTSAGATPNQNLSSKVSIPPSDAPEPAPSEEQSTQFLSQSPDGDAQPAASPSSPAVPKPLGDRTQQLSNVASGQAQNAGSGGTRAPILDADSLKLSYQAFLTDNNGVPLPGPTVNLEFNIYATGAGLVEGPIPANNVPISNGVVDATFAVSASSFDGSGRELGVTVNGGAELAPRAALVTVPYALRVDRVASAELDDDIELGDASTSGSLTVYRTWWDTPSIELSGEHSQISTFGSDGQEQVRLWGPLWGEILLRDDTDNDTTVQLTATQNSGGELGLYDATGRLSVWADGDSTGGSLTLYDASSNDTLRLSGADGTILLGPSASPTLTLDGSQGRAIFATGTTPLILAGHDNTVANPKRMWIGHSQGFPDWGIQYRDMDSDGFPNDRIEFISGDTAMPNFAFELYYGKMTAYDSGGNASIKLEANTSHGAGQFSMLNDSGTETVEIIAAEGVSDNGAQIKLSKANGTTTVVIDAEKTGGSQIDLFDANGTQTVTIRASEFGTQGADLELRNPAGEVTVQLDADVGGTGVGWVITEQLEVTGGADISEHFEIQGHDGQVEPGMVVCIDPHHPAKLLISSRSYDRTVAGVVSGAGGVNAGMLMGQRGSAADGSHPVALTGRVYAWCDASKGAVQPGDLLTTSDTPGHAMKVSDYSAAQGAIIGKAMTALESGEGLVLILVSLQ